MNLAYQNPLLIIKEGVDFKNIKGAALLEPFSRG
jgi:hypothetical protein